MARFDVYAERGSARLFIDCQADILASLKTRFVVPLIPAGEVVRVAERLNPTFVVDGRRMVLTPQAATTIFANQMGKPIASLRDYDLAITAAIDVLTTGV